MRSLKSILGSPLIDERTAIGRRRIPLTEVIEIYVKALKTRAEAFLGRELDQVVHGRPVRFVDGDDTADARAEATLAQIARRAGFRDIAFVYEPIAAAYDYESHATREETVLIADIGGGTSDFTVIRIGPERRQKPDRASDILASAGIRIGGTDFDRLLSLKSVMPLLGLGTQLIEKDLPMPNAPYFDLATWATINFVYTHATEREIATLAKGAREPEKVARLLKVIRRRLGHRIAFAVEDAKLALSTEGATRLALAFVEHDLEAHIARAEFDAAIAEKTGRLCRLARECIADAGLAPNAIDTIFLTGGSSRVPSVRHAIAAAAPQARLARGSDLLAVALGLTRDAARRFG
jgi:hypothetical chaperone protein